ncbi:amidase [Acidisphaera sp. L21]|uniref:amidase n=1 Tax=Acidisphaera sp. L21 TaxID=1641851 RepID=UPI00131B8B0D|nr:amidase [Acidisphaera sp. L21]
MTDLPWPVPALPHDLVARKLPYDPATPLLAPYTACAAAFRDGQDSPRAFLERRLETIEQADPAVRAFVLVDANGARKAADASNARWKAGAPIGPVDGMPVAVKDMIETRDLPTQMNSPIYVGWHPNRDAAAVWALRQAGAVILGKTVTTEFAVSNSGPTRNPYDSTRTPGGSSSGSAAAVGAGMASLALGTQTQASTIRPGGYCGAYAMKPSIDALHTGGVTPLALTQDHLGVFGASLEDMWAGARAIARHVGGNPPHLGMAGPDQAPPPARPRALARLDMQGWGETDGISRAAFDAACDRVANAGVAVADRRSHAGIAALETMLADANDYSYDILAWETKWPLSSYRDHGADMVGKRIHELLAHGAKITADTYTAALARRTALRNQVESLAGEFDGFLALCSSGPAIVHHDYTGSRSYALPWTMVAAPAFALPLLAVEELPLGLQLCGFRDRDAEACAVAGWLRDTVLGRVA